MSTPSASSNDVAVVLTEPSIKVVPAGRCSSTIRKSRSHSGVLAGTLRCAESTMWALPPEATWLATFSNVSGLTATPNPVGSTLPSSSGGAG